jgi:hypothetical protein
MKRWLKRFGMLIFIIFWLMIMCFPTFAFTLSRQQQLQVGNIEGSHLRVFMVIEEGADGIGFEVTRPLLTKSNCLKTSLGYFFWEGGESGQNTSFCQCTQPGTNAPLPVSENSCQ